MLEDYTINERLAYTHHHLVVAGDDDIRIGGVLGAAILCAMLVDTDEGNRRAIAIDTYPEQRAWITRYEREVRRDEWGLLNIELQLLADAYIQQASSTVRWLDICPNIRLMDLAMRLVSTYMQYLTVEAFGTHIWECVEWRAPFAQWLMDAAHVETRRQQFLHTDWMEPAQVTELLDVPDEQDEPTFIFENEDTQDIMKRYLKWAWSTYQAQLRQIPGSQPRAAKHRTFVVQQETDWDFLYPESRKLSDDNQRLWAQWMLDWNAFVRRQLKPEKPLRFWVDGVSELQQRQLTQFLRLQEKEWDYFACVSASVYAMRLLGYVRRACTVSDITRWLTEQLTNDYTTKNNHDQFLRAWKHHGRYTDDVKHFTAVLLELGVGKFRQE
ncbi:MAG: hypothetical protein IJT12_00880 [Paludibacteraceae bacterium]|nr:hypothetical protein [Paludibacteraceae bacterium]